MELEMENESKENQSMKSEVQRPSESLKSRMFRRLLDACRRKDLKLIKSILDQRPELVNECDKQGRCLLHYSVIRTSDERIGEAGDSNGTTSECLDYLMQRCDPRLWTKQDQDGFSILHMAVISSNLPLVERLIFGQPLATTQPLVEILDRERHSPLHWAVITNNLDCVKLLVRSGGTKLAHEPDLNGATPLHYATQTSDYPKYRQQLRRMLHASGSNSDNTNSLSSTTTNCSSSTVTTTTCQTDQSDSQKVLPGKGRRTSCCEASAKTLEILGFLIELPEVNLEIEDRDHRTPLLWAASSGNKEAIEMLLARGASPNSADANRLGALHCAASHGFTDCLEVLLRADGGPDPNQPDNLGCTPLFYGVLSGNVDCVESLLDRGAASDWQDSKGRSAAHFAALKGQLGALKLLKERGANLWLANKQGDLPLHYAIKSGRLAVVKWLLDRSPYERAVNAINNFGRAPIHLAVQRDDPTLTECLIRCGANLNQLVRSRHKLKPVAKDKASPKQTIGQAKYETALDIARSRNPTGECLRLLEVNGALPASDVLGNRKKFANPDSLFEMSSAQADGPSPIGFETSCSSASPNMATVGGSIRRAPKIKQPAPVDIMPEASSSSGSSAMSQNSLTSLRGVPGEQETEADEPNPRFGGGISYNNEHICASIKCNLYDCDGQPARRTAGTRHRSAPSSREKWQQPRGQEIITNVNVYTSPCAHCMQQAHRSRCNDCSSEASKPKPNKPYQTTSGTESDTPVSAERLPDLRGSMLPRPVNRTTQRPPDGDFRLPDLNSTNNEPNETLETGGQIEEATSDGALLRSQASIRRPLVSPAEEEPRFDRTTVPGREGRPVTRYHVRSPVADYIGKRPKSLHRSRLPRAEPVARASGTRTKSMSVLSNASGLSRSSTRSISRQTQILQRGNSKELAVKVEMAIWKYRQESKLFEELQRLKRSQIRSGRANEAVLVKRLAEHLRIEARDFFALEPYHGPYNYKAYERFLYDQLRKLSQSNSAKLMDEYDEQDNNYQSLYQPHTPGDQDPGTGREADNNEESADTLDEQQPVASYLDEDIKADMELRRIIGAEPLEDQNESKDGKLDHDTVEKAEEPIVEMKARQDSRSSTVDLETTNGPVDSDIESRARSLSSAIITDALGNVSRPPSACETPEPNESNETGNQQTTDDDHGERVERDADMTPTSGRRRSIVNFGDKIDVVYHDVGIEIEPAPELEPEDEDSEKQEQTEYKAEEVEQQQNEEEPVDISPKRESKRKPKLEQVAEESEDGASQSEHSVAPLDTEPHNEQTAPVPPKDGSSVSLRRASSPAGDTSAIARRGNFRSAGRSSSSNWASGPKDFKVLSGYDLDARRSSRNLSQQASEQLEEVVEERKLDEGRRDSASQANLSEEEKDESTMATTTTGDAKTDDKASEMEEQPDRARSVIRRSPQSPRRRPRSRLPSKASRPQVDMSIIRARWAPIKAQAKRLRRRQSAQLRGSGGVSAAKSQPNLLHNGCNDLDRADLQGDDEEGEPYEYQLLYEVNRRFLVGHSHALCCSGSCCLGKALVGKTVSGRRLRYGARWCNRLAAQIVDARSIRRTLSLPEVLIYSNDLLKRFNILKL